MNALLRAALDDHGGVLHRATALARVPRHVFEQAARSGRIRRIFPSVYVAADQQLDPDARRRAALVWADKDAALSHTSALVIWRLLPAADPVHVMVPRGAGPTRAPAGVVLHRRSAFDVLVRGIVVRFTRRRLLAEPEAVRREIVDIVRSRSNMVR